MAQIPDSQSGTGAGPRRVTLRRALALFVAAILLVVVTTFSLHMLVATRALLSSAAVNETLHIRDLIDQRASDMVLSGETFLAQMARSNLSQHKDLPARLEPVALILDPLTKLSVIDSAFVGYPDGQFVLYRPLRTKEDRERFQAPELAAVLVQSIARSQSGEFDPRYVFFDAEGRQILSVAKPDYVFDPRTRPWYQEALSYEGQISTPPYVFHTTGAPGLTIARRSNDNSAVVGIDVTLKTLADTLAKFRVTPHTEIALVMGEGIVFGYHDAEKLTATSADGSVRLQTVDELSVPAVSAAWKLPLSKEPSEVTINGSRWQAMRSGIAHSGKYDDYLVIAIPNDEIFALSRDALLRELIGGAVFLALAVAGAMLLTRFLSGPLLRLADETGAIRSFDFSGRANVQSRFKEIHDLASAIETMKDAIRKFMDIGTALVSEQDMALLLQRIVSEINATAGTDGGVLYLLDKKTQSFSPEIIFWHDEHRSRGDFKLASLTPNDALFGASSTTPEQDTDLLELEFDQTQLEKLGLWSILKDVDAKRAAALVVPILSRTGVKLGVLLLLRAMVADKPVEKIGPHLQHLIRAISGSAGIAIENRQLLLDQRNLLDAVIKLTAGAIDSKSPYTGAHCQRVPVLTRELAEAACKQTSGPFADFNLSREEWEAVHLASWLHDCGKVTTPEYVVDKATKLETIYDRIHEVRMRFEVLKRDAEVAYWKGRVEGQDEASLREAMEQEHKHLDEDFAFVARSNEGSEFMEPAKIERLRGIAKRTWRRTIDDRIGISVEEKARKSKSPAPALPTEEMVIADREDHITPREPNERMPDDNPWGFRMPVPAVKFNRGELYNLSIDRGTLTAEERYIINQHITETIVMLSSLPLPDHLVSVPALAGGHHEKMNGTGYPRGLKREEMPLVARMMAIADVFEALTASDRPYKPAKKLSEAMKIMTFMKKDHHLDPDLLDLFASSGIWRRYAETYLAKSQLDEPDIAALLKTQPA